MIFQAPDLSTVNRIEPGPRRHVTIAVAATIVLLLVLLGASVFTDRGEERPILYRASVSEMVVNYGDPGPTHGWQNYFDFGEYQFGRLANSLELGCDCLGEITYLDAVVVDDFCVPQTIRNAICGSTTTSSAAPPRHGGSVGW